MAAVGVGADIGLDLARADGIDADAVSAEFEGELLDDGDLARLGCGVGGGAGVVKVRVPLIEETTMIEPPWRFRCGTVRCRVR